MLNGTCDSEKTVRITVFTPTFNRAYILNKLYDSLKQQTFKDFEWLIVDDGSTDNTQALLKKWQCENRGFSLRYYYQENGGKHRAINLGLEHAKGDIFFVVDSDDYLTFDALEKIDGWFSEIQNKKGYAGVVANRGFSYSETNNSLFEDRYLDKTFLDAETYTENGQRVLSGERAIALYTDLLRKYLYPEFEGEKFLTEAIVYNRIAHDGFLVRYYNDIIWIFEYLPDGLTSRGTELYLDNPRGDGLWFRERAEYLHFSNIDKMHMWYSFYCDLKDRCSIKQIAEYIGASRLAIDIAAIVYKLRHFQF